MRTWQTIHASVLERHSHGGAYAALVLSGSYEEAGDRGRLRVEPGDVILHDRFEAHLDRFSRATAAVLNLPLNPGHVFVPGKGRITDPDEIVRTAERCPAEAIDLALSTVQQRPSLQEGWPDELAATLIEDPSLVLTSWAEAQRLAPWAVSRGFAELYGVSPEGFRARSRALAAWKAIWATEASLADIACQFRFADQSHMCRGIKQLTGVPPWQWRKAANRFKTPVSPGR
jgi:AraC-like DNA-binding protein